MASRDDSSPTARPGLPASVVAVLLERWAESEAGHVSALQEAASYRQLLLITLEAWRKDQLRATRLQERLHQTMGIIDWHPEEPHESE